MRKRAACQTLKLYILTQMYKQYAPCNSNTYNLKNQLNRRNASFPSGILYKLSYESSYNSNSQNPKNYIRQKVVKLSLTVAAKRKHKEETLQTKHAVLHELEKERPNENVTNQFRIPDSSISIWKKYKKIFRNFSKVLSKTTKSQSGNNQTLLKLFTSMCGNNIPINGLILLEKPREFDDGLNCKDF